MTARAKQPLRILMVSARFAPFVGGTEIHTGVVAAELVRRGHEVTVATTDLSGELASTGEQDGVRVVRTRAWPRRSDLYLAPGLAAVIGDGEWDLVHVQGYHTAVAPLALAVARRRGIPTALTFHSGGHSSVVRNALRPVHTRLLKRLLLGVDLLIGVSEFEADLFARRLGIDPDRIEVIPNGVPEFKPTLTDGDAPLHPVPASPTGEAGPVDRARLQLVADGPTILSLGRLVRYKGHHRVIRALPHLLAVDPTISLVILGRGPYRHRLERLVSRLGLDEHVTFDFVPSHERSRLNQIMSHASLAILLSNYESHGMAAHEALSAGLPLIVLDRTALSDLVSAGLAQAVPPSATDREVASIVLRTLTDAAGSEASAIRSPALARIQHSWPKIVDRLESAYLSVLGRPEPAVGDGGPASGAADR